jgi:methyltransferase (TIGR00027 family)
VGGDAGIEGLLIANVLSMNPIARTAYYCCGVRMKDARSADPLCGDDLAHHFMDAEAQELFRQFECFRGPNASNVARHRIIDDLLRKYLQINPRLRVLLLGAGFDTRAFRLAGGQWLELDQPALISFKESRLPSAGAPNSLQRVGIDFARESLAGKLAHWQGDESVVVVMEGVSMYLGPEQLQATLDTLGEVFPRHLLVCDLMTPAFSRRYSSGLRRRIRELGGDFAQLLDDPAQFVTASGYRQLGRFSIARRAVEHGTLPIPRWIFNTLLRSLRDGYQIHVFESADSLDAPE